MNSIKINGTDIFDLPAGSYQNVVIKDGQIIANGVNITPEAKTISIVITGDVQSFDVDNCQEIHVTGNVGNVRSGSGDVSVQSAVLGNIQTGSGDVECEQVHGSIQTGSGDVSARNVGGSVKTGSGDIKYVKFTEDVSNNSKEA